MKYAQQCSSDMHEPNSTNTPARLRSPCTDIAWYLPFGKSHVVAPERCPVTDREGLMLWSALDTESPVTVLEQVADIDHNRN